jgi:hypothetical protein
MDIYKFILSPDIAAHCRKIEHVFNSLDMAVLVAISDKTLKEKHEAWREIIINYPDMPIRASNCFSAQESLHDYLRKLIVWEEKQIETFYTLGNDVVYHFRVQRRSEWSDEQSGVYTTYDKAWAAVWERWERERDQVTCVMIKKSQLDSDDCAHEAYVNPNGELLSLSLYMGDDRPDNLDMIFIHIPMPFVYGDLVEHDSKPAVLTYLPHWRIERPGITYEERLSGKHGDGSDMHANVHYVGDNGTLDYAHVHLYEFNFWRGELTGQNRFLKHLSYFIKQRYGYNDIYELETLISAFCRYKAKADSEMLGSMLKFAEDRLVCEDAKVGGDENETRNP